MESRLLCKKVSGYGNLQIEISHSFLFPEKALPDKQPILPRSQDVRTPFNEPFIQFIPGSVIIDVYVFEAL